MSQVPPYDSFPTEPLQVARSELHFISCSQGVKRSTHAEVTILITADVEPNCLDGNWTSIVFTPIYIRGTSLTCSHCRFNPKIGRNDHRSGEAAFMVTHLAQYVQTIVFIPGGYHIRFQHLW